MRENKSISPTQAKDEMYKLKSELRRFINVVGGDLDNVIRNEFDPNEMFLREQAVSITYQFEKVLSDVEYLYREINHEGNLYLNNQGRYEINDYCYLTSGSVCELLVKDDDYDNMVWLKTSIEHDGIHGYYAVKLGREYSIDGLRARVRR